jgi:hypothetical protein
MFNGRVRALTVVLIAAAFSTAIENASLAIEVVTVEEHWELRLGEPVTDLCAPQASMVMSPTSDLSDCFFMFTLNHQTEPEYASGGLQVQRWEGDNSVDSTNSSSVSELWHQNEVITWVQRLRLQGGQLDFKIMNGESETWDEFGNDELRLRCNTDLENLNDYRPGLSIQESGVSYAGNRVRSLTLTRLVWTTADGQSFELNAPIDLDTDLDP